MSAEADRRPQLGFAGLGKMGLPMARNLVKAGFTVVVYNRSHTVVQSLVEECKVYTGKAVAAKTPMDLAEVDVLLNMTANDAALQSVVVDSGLLAAMGDHWKRRKTDGAAQADSSTSYPFDFPIHVSCATLSVHFVQQQVALHKTHGVEYVAMPVMGRPDAAAAAQLHLLFAGSELVRNYLEPLLLVPTLGQSLRYYGPEPEKANVMKVAFNFTLACSIEAMSEGCALVQKYGIEPHAFTSVLGETLFNCPAYRNYGSIISGRQFKPAGATLSGVGLKDCKLALDAGERAEVPLPFASVMRDHYLEGMAAGMGDWDWSALAVVAEHHAGIHKNEEEEREKIKRAKEAQQGPGPQDKA